MASYSCPLGPAACSPLVTRARTSSGVPYVSCMPLLWWSQLLCVGWYVWLVPVPAGCEALPCAVVADTLVVGAGPSMAGCMFGMCSCYRFTGGWDKPPANSLERDFHKSAFQHQCQHSTTRSPKWLPQMFPSLAETDPRT